MMSSLRAPSKLANPIRTKDVANAFHRYLQGLCRNQPKCGMRKAVRSSPHSAGAPRCPFVQPMDTEPGHVNTAQLFWIPRDLFPPSTLPQEQRCCLQPQPSSWTLPSWQSISTTLPAQEGSPGICTPAKSNPNHTPSNWRLFHTRLFIHGASPFTLQIQKPTHSWEKNKSSVPRLSIYNGSSFSAVAFALSSDTHEAFNLEPTKLQNHLRVLTRLCSVLLTGTNSRISV